MNAENTAYENVPKVSVVIPRRNERRYIRDVIDCVSTTRRVGHSCFEEGLDFTAIDIPSLDLRASRRV